MSDITRVSGFLDKYGKTLIQNGYSIVPIPVGSKSPGFDGWQNTKATPGLVTEWINSGHHKSGIGILTKTTPAIDLDITDEEVAKKIEDWCMSNLGFSPVRVGRAPRRVLVYRTDEPFSKMKTGKFKDEWGEEHEIEILCNGQQFVAYGLHKDTNKPYEWVTSEEPANTHVSDLPTITKAQCQELMDYFVSVAEEHGWERSSNGLTGKTRPIDAEDDPFADVETTVEISSDELRLRLMTIPGSEDHDRWVQVGMALFHQYGGDDEGLKLWHEWSETADNYDAEVLDKRWKSFQIEGKGRAPVTARTILKLAKEAATTLIAQTTIELKDAFMQAKDEGEWRAISIKVKHAEIDALARAQLVEIAKKRYFEITGTKLPIAEVRKQLSYEMKNPERTPSWCHDWVYDASDDKFFHIRTKITMTMQGFNAVYSRHALTKQDIMEGRTNPSATPVDLALNRYEIPTVFGRMYAPGQDSLFYHNGLHMANTYLEYQVPDIPKELRPIDHLAIKRVKGHIAHLIADEWEQGLLMDWLAWVVQNPGKRVNWALLLQGVEGDGKSFFAFLLSAVMGPDNVRMLNANVLESDFTGWAQGQCVIAVEEPRLQGHNKYDVINKIKPLITNSIIEVHPKGRDPRNVVNTTNYFMATNFRDALPLNDNDRRYCVLFSRWQQRSSLVEFNKSNPDYYLNLYKTLEDCAPALRKWLIEHEVSPDFPAGGDAPSTTAHSYMVAAATPEPITAIDEVIKENQHYDISEELINATALPDALIGRDIELPGTQGLKRLLEHNGYIFLGRFQIDDKFGRFWSKAPDQFREGDLTSASKIRDFLKTRKAKLDFDEL